MWYTAGRPNKYRAKKTEYNGRIYDSKAEASEAQNLDLRLKCKDIAGWTPQVPVKLVVNGQLISRVVIDFEVTHNDGSIEWVEKKGFKTRDYILKAKLIKALFPNIKYTVV